MMRTHLRDELDLLLRIGALDAEELARRTPAATRRASSVAGPVPPAPPRRLTPKPSGSFEME